MLCGGGLEYPGYLAWLGGGDVGTWYCPWKLVCGYRGACPGWNNGAGVGRPDVAGCGVALAGSIDMRSIKPRSRSRSSSA